MESGEDPRLRIVSRTHLIRHGLRTGLGATALLAPVALGACAPRESQAPGERLELLDDVPQPPPVSPHPLTAPDQWRTVAYDGQSLALPTGALDAVPGTSWGIYQTGYDLVAEEQPVHHVLLSQRFARTTAEELRQAVAFRNALLIEGYDEGPTISWQTQSGATIERTAFFWGPRASRPGYSWKILASESGAATTCFSRYSDDVLRNAIEETLALDGSGA